MMEYNDTVQPMMEHNNRVQAMTKYNNSVQAIMEHNVRAIANQVLTLTNSSLLVVLC